MTSTSEQGKGISLLIMHASKRLDLLSSGLVSANVVMYGKKLMLIGEEGAPNRMFVEEIPQDHQFWRNVKNKGGAPSANRSQRNPQKKKEIMLSPAEKVVEDDRKRAQQKNDLAANAKIKKLKDAATNL